MFETNFVRSDGLTEKMDKSMVRDSRGYNAAAWRMLLAPMLGGGTAACASSARRILNMRFRFVPAKPGTPVQISTTPKGLSHVKARAGALSQVSDGFTFAPLVPGPLRVPWAFAHRRIVVIYDIAIL